MDAHGDNIVMPASYCEPSAGYGEMCAPDAGCSYGDPGYADCDRVGNNGCEIDTTSNVSNCGSCGQVCTPGSNVTTPAPARAGGAPWASMSMRTDPVNQAALPVAGAVALGDVA